MLVCAFLVLLLWPAAVCAALVSTTAGAPGLADFRMRQWTVDEGLPQGHSACLKQTRDGYLWIGTLSGLARFDGMRFTLFNKFNTPELVSDTVNSMDEDVDGTLWLGTHAGLVTYRDHHFQRISTIEALLDEKVWNVRRARDGGVWLHGGDRVARVTAGRFSKAWKRPIGTKILSLQERADGWLNVFTDAGWLALSPEAEQWRTNYVVPPGGPAWVAALADHTNRLWFGTARGLFVLDGAACSAVTPEQVAGTVDMIWEDHAGHLWINIQERGLFRRDSEGWQRAAFGEGIAESSTLCALEDLEGNIWLGQNLGLFCLSPQPIHAYTTREGLGNNDALSVCEGTDGSVWVGTSRGLSCIRGGRVERLLAAEPLLQCRDQAVWPEPNGAVWVAKPGEGIWKCGPDWKGLSLALIPGSPNSLYGDRVGRLWIGAEGGAAAMEPEHPERAGVILTNTCMREVRSILQAHDGTMWFGMSKHGLARWRDGALTFFTVRDGLSDNSVWSLLEDEEGTLWLGTDKGFCRYRDGKFVAFKPANGLPEQTINCVLEDAAGDLWLSGLRGIHRVHRASLNAVADGRAVKAQFVTLGTADGMANPETNGGETQPAGWKARDGRLWFPTVKGVVVLDPKRVRQNEEPPPVVIEQVSADGQLIYGERDTVPAERRRKNTDRIRPSAPTRIGPGHGRVLEFRFTANAFSAPEQARFKYRLVGADPGWREETRERTAQYINLRPGHYRFEVTAGNHHNIWNPQPVLFAFSLAPHFWQTGLFYVLCAGMLGGLATAVQGYRLRWQRRLLKLEEQRALANERARIARDLHDDLGTALTGLALELDVAGREAGATMPVTEKLAGTAQRTRALAERMREVVWTVNPKCDTVSSLAGFLEQQVSQFLRSDDVRVRLDFPEAIPDLPLNAEARHQLALSVREALTNVIRHAQATEVTLSLAVANGLLVVSVKDNGRGIQRSESDGHGLNNMRARMKQAGGTFDCECAPGQGTTITFRLPLDRDNQGGSLSSEKKPKPTEPED